MATATYDTLVDVTQEEIHTILKNDATVLSLTTKIVDGLPYTQMQRGIGFPYIQVPTPEYTEERYTFTKSKVLMSVNITIFSTKASTLRQLTDAVRKALTDNQNTTSLAKLRDRKLPVANYNQSLLENGKVMYQETVEATYTFIGAIR